MELKSEFFFFLAVVVNPLVRDLSLNEQMYYFSLCENSQSEANLPSLSDKRSNYLLSLSHDYITTYTYLELL